MDIKIIANGWKESDPLLRYYSMMAICFRKNFACFEKYR